MPEDENEPEGSNQDNQNDLIFKAAERSEVKRLLAFKSLMATTEGRRWIWWLLDRCGVFRTSYTGDHTTYFNEGTRNVGLMVIADINALCPEQYLTMMTEAREPA